MHFNLVDSKSTDLSTVHHVVILLASRTRVDNRVVCFRGIKVSKKNEQLLICAQSN